MSLPFYFNNNPIGYTDFLVFRTNKMVGLAGDIDFSRNTSGSLTTAIWSSVVLIFKLSNSNTISFSSLLVYQLITLKKHDKKYCLYFNK